jgi:hypothetical protein
MEQSGLAPGAKGKALHFTTDHTVRGLRSDRALRASTLTPVCRIEDCIITSLAETVRSSLGWLGQRGSDAVSVHQRESGTGGRKKSYRVRSMQEAPESQTGTFIVGRVGLA